MTNNDIGGGGKERYVQEIIYIYIYKKIDL